METKMDKDLDKRYVTRIELQEILADIKRNAIITVIGIIIGIIINRWIF
jgi:hypothetical protein